MKKLLVVTTTMFLIAGLVQTVDAKNWQRQDRGKRHCDMGAFTPLIHAPWNRVESLIADLNMTPEQVTQIKSLREAYRKNIVPLMDQLRYQQRELREQLDMNEISKDKALEMTDKISKIEKNLLEEKIKLQYDVKGLLTIEQQKALKAQMRENREMNREHRGMKGDRQGRGQRQWNRNNAEPEM
ncbi:Spy/CpxP family protein refolding chaperone [bacterium]|nr:Spy/CpxP family protein refolding chaperone [candidate division CSSED10-310 bacterium]